MSAYGEQINAFNWDRLANEQGRFPEKMTINVWFQSHVFHINGAPTNWTIKGEIVRVIFELIDERKPLAEAHVVWMITLNYNEIQKPKQDFFNIIKP